MKKCKEVALQLLDVCEKKFEGVLYPKIVCSCLDRDNGQGYHLSYAARTLTIKAESSLSAVYALSLLEAVIPSGHWHEYLGVSKPRFVLRPLWVRTDVKTEVDLHRICRCLITLGYNALIWNGGESLGGIPGEYGIKSIIKAQEELLDEKILSSADYVFIEASLLHRNPKLTLSEFLIKEMARLEDLIPDKTNLIYYVPCEKGESSAQAALLIQSLWLEAKSKTCIAFPAFIESVTDDLLPHPLWEFLRSIPTLEGTLLLPVYEINTKIQKGGVPPVVPIEQIEHMQAFCKRHSFAGCVYAIKELGSEIEEQNVALWVASQAAWRDILAPLLLDTFSKGKKSTYLSK